MFINKVMIYGNLTRDPEVRQSSTGINIANLGVATNRKYKNQQGELVEEVEYHKVVMFGRLADLAQQYLATGSGVYIEGRLRTSSWQDDSGTKKYSTEIICEQMQFGPKRVGAGGAPAPAAPASQPKAAGPQKESTAPTINPDDIPF